MEPWKDGWELGAASASLHTPCGSQWGQRNDPESSYFSHLLLKLSKCLTCCSQHNFSSCKTCWDYRLAATYGLEVLCRSPKGHNDSNPIPWSGAWGGRDPKCLSESSHGERCFLLIKSSFQDSIRTAIQTTWKSGGKCKFSTPHTYPLSIFLSHLRTLGNIWLFFQSIPDIICWNSSTGGRGFKIWNRCTAATWDDAWWIQNCHHLPPPPTLSPRHIFVHVVYTCGIVGCKTGIWLLFETTQSLKRIHVSLFPWRSFEISCQLFIWSSWVRAPVQFLWNLVPATNSEAFTDKSCKVCLSPPIRLKHESWVIFQCLWT